MRAKRLTAFVAMLMLCIAVAGLAPAGAGAAGIAGWGENEAGELGNGTTALQRAPTTVLDAAGTAPLEGVQAVAAGSNFSLALLESGKVLAWGYNASGQLGNESRTTSFLPVEVKGLTHVKQLAAGSEFAAALLESGHVMVWGQNNFGQLAKERGGSSTVPVEVSGLSGVTAISIGPSGSYVLALLESGEVMAWGDNDTGELGNGSTAETDSTPGLVSELSHVLAISAGTYHALALVEGNTVKAWGDNTQGELGIGTETGPEVCGGLGHCYRTPVSVSELSGVTAVAAGGAFSLALTEGHTVKAWGIDKEGQLGNGTTAAHFDSPVSISGLSEVAEISAGLSHSLALLKSGDVDAWGSNSRGQLGIGSTGSYKDSPVSASELSGVTAVQAGALTSLSLGSVGPYVTAVSPPSGTSAGGTTVKVEGTGFTGAKAVLFGSEPGTGLTVESGSKLSVSTPARKPSTVHAYVTGANGITSSPDSVVFTYLPIGNIEFGRCLNLGAGKGKYKTGTCTELAEGSGRYEWEALSREITFTSADTVKEGSPKPISLSSGTATLSCQNESGTGAYEEPKAVGSVRLVFTECELGGSRCHSAGAAEGEVASATLGGGLGWREEAGNDVGLELRAASEGESFLEATCGSNVVSVKGAVIGWITPVNNMSGTFNLKFKTSKGKQVPEQFDEVGAAARVLEMRVGAEGAYETAALAFESVLSNHEELEIDTH